MSSSRKRILSTVIDVNEPAFTPLPEEWMKQICMFQEVHLKSSEDVGSLRLMHSLSRVRFNNLPVGSIVIMPAYFPLEGEMLDVDFINSYNFWLLKVERINVITHSFADLKVLGLREDDPELLTCAVGTVFSCRFPKKSNVLTLVEGSPHWTALAHVIGKKPRSAVEASRVEENNSISSASSSELANPSLPADDVTVLPSRIDSSATVQAASDTAPRRPSPAPSLVGNSSSSAPPLHPVRSLGERRISFGAASSSTASSSSSPFSGASHTPFSGVVAASHDPYSGSGIIEPPSFFDRSQPLTMGAYGTSLDSSGNAIYDQSYSGMIPGVNYPHMPSDALTLGKTFTDLDGCVRRSGIHKLSSDDLVYVLGLVRLLSPLRLTSFLKGYRFNLNKWTNIMTTESDNSHRDSSPFRSIVGYSRTFNFQVHKDKVLLALFLKGDWSPNDWSSGLNLSAFVSSKETPLAVGRSSTRDGRRSLSVALKGLSLMCSIHFDPKFCDMAKDLCEALEADNCFCKDYHDIFVRYRIEIMVSEYFKEIFTHETSILFVGQKMSNPGECVDLFTHFVDEFIVGGLALKEKQPHYLWYSQEGTAQCIRVDYNTLRLLDPLVEPFRSPSDPPSNSKGLVYTETSTSKTNRSKSSEGVTPENKPCIWFLASQLRYTFPGAKDVVSCTRNCTPDCHQLLSNIKLEEAIELMKGCNWSVKVKTSFTKLFNDNSKKFKR